MQFLAVPAPPAASRAPRSHPANPALPRTSAQEARFPRETVSPLLLPIQQLSLSSLLPSVALRAPWSSLSLPLQDLLRWSGPNVRGIHSRITNSLLHRNPQTGLGTFFLNFWYPRASDFKIPFINARNSPSRRRQLTTASPRELIDLHPRLVSQYTCPAGSSRFLSPFIAPSIQLEAIACESAYSRENSPRRSMEGREFTSIISAANSPGRLKLRSIAGVRSMPTRETCTSAAQRPGPRSPTAPKASSKARWRPSASISPRSKPSAASTLPTPTPGTCRWPVF